MGRIGVGVGGGGRGVGVTNTILVGGDSIGAAVASPDDGMSTDFPPALDPQPVSATNNVRKTTLAENLFIVVLLSV
jgi:hypothetical protein